MDPSTVQWKWLSSNPSTTFLVLFGVSSDGGYKKDIYLTTSHHSPLLECEIIIEIIAPHKPPTSTKRINRRWQHIPKYKQIIDNNSIEYHWWLMMPEKPKTINVTLSLTLSQSNQCWVWYLLYFSPPSILYHLLVLSKLTIDNNSIE